MNFTKINLWFTFIVMVSFFTACKKDGREMNPKGEYAPSVQNTATCTYTIPLNQSVVDAKSLNIGPGSVVCLEAGTRGPLILRNFVGSPTSPIIFVNKGGKVTFKTSGSYGVKVENSKYLKFTGTGSSSHKYGIEIDGPHIGITFEKLTTNLELEYAEIHNIGFAGVMCKTDPSCDQSTWRDNFVMRDIVMHHNYIYKTGGEGFYIGNSFYASGRSLSCGNIMPHSIENLSLYDNIVRYTDAEGIQVGCVIRGAKIYNNTIEYYGQSPFANYQNNGLQIGEGTGGLCYNNVIKNGPGNGMIVLGLGDNVIFNNLIINSGENGVFVDERYTPGSNFAFYNNTIVNAGQDGMRFYSEKIPMNTVVNNIIINPGSGKFINTSNGVRLTESNNFTSKNVADVKFVNASAGDYRLQAGSPAIDAGANVASKGVTFDLTGAGRPAGKGFDIGAYEFGATGGNDGGSGGGNDGGSSGPGDGDIADIKVASLTLVNAETHKDIMTMTPGMVIDFSKIGTSKINIRANAASSKVGSIVFGL
ncbi:MAG TPA: right-handed parallel beta-helix repeat-containing protein, partial [Cytophagaceae bacterium]